MKRFLARVFGATSPALPGAAAAYGSMEFWTGGNRAKPATVAEANSMMASLVQTVSKPKLIAEAPGKCEFHVRPRSSLGTNAAGGRRWATYGPRIFEPSRAYSWHGHFQVGDRVPVLVDQEVMTSDEGIIHVFSHELYEIRELESAMQGSSLTGERISELVRASGRLDKDEDDEEEEGKPNLHGHACRVADLYLREWRELSSK